MTVGCCGPLGGGVAGVDETNSRGWVSGSDGRGCGCRRGFRLRLGRELVQAFYLFEGGVVIAVGGVDDALEAGELLVDGGEGLSGGVSLEGIGSMAARKSWAWMRA